MQTMELTVGTILEGKVKSITNFGAFVALPENKTGMVHISEVANAYVSDIRQHLTEGQDVKVMVIGNENGKINLSIKRLEPKPQRENNFQRRDSREGGFRGSNGGFRREGGQRSDRPQSDRPYSDRPHSDRPYSDRPHSDRPQNRSQGRPQRAPMTPPVPKTADQLFEEKLKAFMSESDSKISSIKQYSDHRTKNSRRR